MASADFIVRLRDRITGPAKRAAGGIGALDRKIKGIRGAAGFKALDRFSNKVIDVAKNASLMGGALGAAGAVGFTGAVVGAGDAALRTQRAFTLLTGSVVGGKAAWQETLELSKGLGMELGETGTQMKKLLAAQFTIGESSELIKMVQDLKTIGVEGEATGRVLMAISQIKAKGRLQAEEMLQLAEAGVSTQLVMESLQKATGKTGDEVRKLQQAGKIDAAMGLDAIRSAVKKKLGVDTFGTAAAGNSVGTIEGMIGRIKGSWSRMLERIATAAGPLVEAVRPAFETIEKMLEGVQGGEFAGFIKDMVANFVALVPLAKEFIGGFASKVGDLLGGVRLDFGAADMEKAFRFGEMAAGALATVLSIVKMLGRAFAFLGTPVGSFLAKAVLLAAVAVKLVIGYVAVAAAFAKVLVAAKFLWLVITTLWVAFKVGLLVVGAIAAAFPLAFAAIVAAVVAAGVAIYVWWDEITEFFSGAWDWFAEVGSNMIDGLVAGIKAGVGRAAEAVRSLASNVIGVAKGVLDINSPSRVFEGIGLNTGAGMIKGLDASAYSVQRSMDAMTTPPNLGHLGASSGGAPNVSVNATFNISGGDGSADEIAQAISESLAAKLSAELGGRAVTA